MSNKDDDEGSCYSYVQEDNEPNDIPKSIITTTPIEKKKKKKRKHSSTGGDDTASSLVTDSLVSSGSKKKKKKKDKKRKSKDNRASNDWQPPAGLPPEEHQEQQQLSPPSTDEILKLASQKLSQHQQQTSSGSIFSLIAKPTTTANNSKLKKSPYQVKTILGTVALLPTSLPNVPQCIKSLLQTLLLMYDSNMGGVLLSLEDDIKLLPIDYKAPSSSRGGSSSNNNRNSSGLIGGRIVDDLPYIHYKFQINGLLFCPTLNMKLTGQVIECTQTYITLTTHHILSTKISTEKLQEVGFYYNETSFEWERKNDTLGGPLTTIYLDDRVDFIVERIHECGGYISLDGMRPEVSTLG